LIHRKASSPGAGQASAIPMRERQAMDENKDSERKRTWTEEIEVNGAQLMERIRELIAEGRVRRLRIKAADGSLILEIPLVVGALAGSAVALGAPLLAVLGAFAALVARAKIEIVREDARSPPGGA
jgi:hypothetical protein